MSVFPMLLLFACFAVSISNGKNLKQNDNEVLEGYKELLNFDCAQGCLNDHLREPLPSDRKDFCLKVDLVNNCTVHKCGYFPGEPRRYYCETMSDRELDYWKCLVINYEEITIAPVTSGKCTNLIRKLLKNDITDEELSKLVECIAKENANKAEQKCGCDSDAADGFSGMLKSVKKNLMTKFLKLVK